MAVRVDNIELPSGKRTTREIVEHGDSVAIVAIAASVALVDTLEKTLEHLATQDHRDTLDSVGIVQLTG